MHFNPNRIGTGRAVCRTSHRELSFDGELTILKICIPILPNIHCIGRHRTRLAALQFGTIYMAIVRITRHIDSICFNPRFPIYNERGGLIQLIDRITVFLLSLRGIRSPSSDNDFSALLNTGSRLFPFRICCRRIPRHIQLGTIRNVELPFVLHQYIFHVGSTAINSDRSDRQTFFYRTIIILFFRVRKCISRIQPISRCITILQRDGSIICPSASSYLRTIDFRFTSIIYIKCILSTIDTATIYSKSTPIIYRNFTISFAAINEIDLISGQLRAVL